MTTRTKASATKAAQATETETRTTRTVAITSDQWAILRALRDKIGDVGMTNVPTSVQPLLRRTSQGFIPLGNVIEAACALLDDAIATKTKRSRG